MSCFRRGKKYFVSTVSFLLSLLLLTGTLLFGQTLSAVAQESSIGCEAPINPQFAKYIEDLQSAKIKSMNTEGNYKQGLKPSPIDFSYLKGKKAFLSAAILPTAYNLRTQGKLTPVRNQGTSGCCWAFATYASLESCLLPNETLDFSENNLKNTSGFDGDPNIDGGDATMSTAYLTRWSGPVSESADPYDPNSITSPSGLKPIKHVQEVLYLPPRESSSDNDTIKQAIMRYGAIYSDMDYNQDDPSYYNDSTDAYYFDGNENSDHSISIVGWDDNFAASKFSITPPGNGAFIVRNSWGTDWGDKGYFYVSYYDHNLGMGQNVVFDNAEPITNYKDIYQYDPLGQCGSYGYYGPTAWMSNVFNATSNNPLSAVGFYALEPNTTYEISVYTNVTSGPISGTLVGGKQTGTITVPGYHTIPLSSTVPITSGQKFSVVVKVTTPGYNYPIAVEEPIEGWSSEATASAGQSYTCSDGISWRDITKSKPNENICLKAYTTATVANTLQSIAITTPATKLSYNIGDNLDITGLVVTGTYSDGSTKVEPITTANITGFNSATAVTDQVLTITVGAKTTTYNVQIVTAPIISVTGVSLNKNITTINVGANETLIATVSPSNATNKNVTWESNDPSVATVDTSGLVTAVSPGETTITVNTTDGDTTDSCDVTVTELTKTAKALSADPSTLNLSLDETSDPITLTATYTDGLTEDITDSATWTSKNPSVATVDEYGAVTGVALGSTTITGTYGGKTATITVTVIPELDHILVQPGSVGVAKGKTQSVTIYAVYADGSTTDITKSIRLTSDDKTVATVTGATIKGITADCDTIVSGTYLDQDIEIPVTVTQPLKTLITDTGTSGLNLSIDDSETVTLTATYADGSSEEVNDCAVGVSSKPSVATVDVSDGNITVTGVAKGSATITLNYEGKKVTVKVKVTVTA